MRKVVAPFARVIETYRRSVHAVKGLTLLVVVLRSLCVSFLSPGVQGLLTVMSLKLVSVSHRVPEGSNALAYLNACASTLKDTAIFEASELATVPLRINFCPQVGALAERNA